MREPIRRLQPDDRFAIWSGREGKLLFLGPGSALVEYEGEKRTFVSKGKKITLTPKERTRISLDTLVERR